MIAWRDRGKFKRQFCSKFNPATVLTRFEEVAKAGVQVVDTDLPQAMLGYFVNLALKSKELPVTNVALVPPQIDPADPDFDAIRGMVKAAIANPQAAQQH